MYHQLFVFGIVILGKSPSIVAKITDLEYGFMPKLFYFEDFDRCIHYTTDSKYCMITVKLRPENPKNASQVWKIIEETSSNPLNYRHDLLRHGVCVKDTCPTCNGTTHDKIDILYKGKYKNLGLVSKVIKIKCETKKSKFVIGTGDIIFVALIGLYFIFVLMVTFVMHFAKSEKWSKTVAGQIFLSFSIFENWRILTKIDPKEYKEDFMPSTQGIRFVCTIWVIYIHTAEEILAVPALNPKYAEEAPTRFITSYHSNGGILVQIFFIISAWFLVVSVMEKSRKSGKMSLSYTLFYIMGRYLRLVPLTAVVVAFSSTIMVHLSRGPFWDMMVGEEYRTCRREWWQNVLFINNFDTTDGICMLQSWYMSSDFQMFLASILILWILQKHPRRIYIVFSLVTIIHIVVVFCVLFWNNWEIGIKIKPELVYNNTLIYQPQWNAVWASTYSSIPGYSMGIIFGYLSWQFRGKKFFTKKVFLLLGWIVCFVCLPVLILSHTYYITTDAYATNRWFGAIFGSLSKAIFVFGIGVGLLGMSQKHGGFIRKFFEYPFFHILAQLSYGAFLIHFTIIKLRFGSMMSPPYLSDMILANEVIVIVSLSYIGSFVLTLFIQMPATLLTKKMMYML